MVKLKKSKIDRIKLFRRLIRVHLFKHTFKISLYILSLFIHFQILDRKINNIVFWMAFY